MVLKPILRINDFKFPAVSENISHGMLSAVWFCYEFEKFRIYKSTEKLFLQLFDWFYIIIFTDK